MAERRRRSPQLSVDEIQRALGDYPPIITVKQLAQILNLSESTIYFWISRDRLRGAMRKRGRHNLIWRDRVISLIFDGVDWSPDE